jgi:hypothetical protein
MDLSNREDGDEEASATSFVFFLFTVAAHELSPFSNKKCFIIKFNFHKRYTIETFPDKCHCLISQREEKGCGIV